MSRRKITKEGMIFINIRFQLAIKINKFATQSYNEPNISYKYIEQCNDRITHDIDLI